MSSLNLLANNQEKTLNKVVSVGRLSEYSDSKFMSITTIAGMTKTEKVLSEKLAYEWKNLYRNFVAQDPKDNGLINIKEFDQVCLKFKINFTREEMRQIKKLFGDESGHVIQMGAFTDKKRSISSSMVDQVNYKTMSNNLGLHKASMNHLSSTLSAARVRKLFKLRECMKSIEPVEERDENEKSITALEDRTRK